jgi:hypothetical protein
VDVLKASFPAGTVTGAPKVRAMQIIDELEPGEARSLQRCGRIPRLQRRHGRRDCDPHRGREGPHASRAGCGRRRRRFDS